VTGEVCPESEITKSDINIRTESRCLFQGRRDLGMKTDSVSRQRRTRKMPKEEEVNDNEIHVKFEGEEPVCVLLLLDSIKDKAPNNTGEQLLESLTLGVNFCLLQNVLNIYFLFQSRSLFFKHTATVVQFNEVKSSDERRHQSFESQKKKMENQEEHLKKIHIFRSICRSLRTHKHSKHVLLFSNVR
jgi:hypothetical protein